MLERSIKDYRLLFCFYKIFTKGGEELKEDCFAYDPKRRECSALTETVCRNNESCHFYKTKNKPKPVSKSKGGGTKKHGYSAYDDYSNRLYNRNTSSGVMFSSKRQKRG